MVNQQSLNELALFAGAGGGILGGKLLGWRTVCAVEWEPYPASILCARQNDGLLPPFPIWDDVQTFDGKPWRGIVDVISGGFPCQDISAAGKGDGLDGARSGMWRHMARVVGEVRPRYVFVENSPMLTTRGGTRVVGDLTKMGYDCRWTVMGAADVGANHQRDRIWIVGKITNTTINRLHDKENQRILEGQGRCELQPSESGDSREMADTSQLFSYGSNDNPRISLGRKTQSKSGDSGWKKNVGQSKRSGLEGQRSQPRQQEVSQPWNSGSLADTTDEGNVWRQWVMGFAEQEHDQRRSQTNGSREWWQAEPDMGRVADGVAARVDRLKAIGNGQVPLCAAEAWRLLTK